MVENVAHYGSLSSEDIEQRLAELDQEWDIERTLEANASTLILLGVSMAAYSRNKNWLFLPGVVSAFLLQHALQGWCPPMPVFRRMGVRTQREIDEERFALKLLRGDFDQFVAEESYDPNEVLQAVQV